MASPDFYGNVYYSENAFAFAKKMLQYCYLPVFSILPEETLRPLFFNNSRQKKA